MVIHERAEKVLALSYNRVAGSARRIDRFYFWICYRAVHLHALLALSPLPEVGPEGPLERQPLASCVACPSSGRAPLSRVTSSAKLCS